MSSLPLGPAAIPMAHALLYLALCTALLCGWWLGRKRQANPEAALFAMFGAGVLAARLGFVVRYAEEYSATPWQAVDIRDGGFLLWPGLLAAVIIGLTYAWRRPALRRPLGIAVLVGGVLWGGGRALLAALEHGSRLPALSLVDMSGHAVQLDSLDGRPLVVNIWATWCPPCRREMPVLAAAQRAEPQVRFVFVNSGEDAATVRRFLGESGLQLEGVLLDSGNRVGAATGSFGLPTTLFYDAEGRQSHSHMGELSAASLRHNLKRLRQR